MFTNTEGTTSPAVVLGANRSGSVDPKRGDFAGIVAHSYANPYSSTGIYSDKVYFDSHGGELIQVVGRLKIIVKVVKCEPFSVITLSNIVMN